MDSNHPTDPQEPNHMIVRVNTGQRVYFIETTSTERMEPYDDSLIFWYLELMEQ
jgi:hypothetical protein